MLKVTRLRYWIIYYISILAGISCGPVTALNDLSGTPIAPSPPVIKTGSPTSQQVAPFPSTPTLQATNPVIPDSPSPAWEYQSPYIYSVDEIECNVQPLSRTKLYLEDEIFVSQSTKEDLLALFGEPTHQFPFLNYDPDDPKSLSETWFWSGEYQTWAGFRNNLVAIRNEPRSVLSEIIGYYGNPELVVWEIPKIFGHDMIVRTYLLYPQKGVFFENEGQIYQFFSETIIFNGTVVSISDFDYFRKLYGIMERTDLFHYVTFPWPCG